MVKVGQKIEGSIYGYRQSYWLLGCMSVFGNRCDVTEQVGITGIGDIASLNPTLNMLSPPWDLSLGHMFHSHITPGCLHPIDAQRNHCPTPCRTTSSVTPYGWHFWPSLCSLPPALLHCCFSKNGIESLVLFAMVAVGGNLCWWEEKLLVLVCVLVWTKERPTVQLLSAWCDALPRSRMKLSRRTWKLFLHLTPFPKNKNAARWTSVTPLFFLRSLL